jgi:hypothetical protein
MPRVAKNKLEVNIANESRDGPQQPVDSTTDPKEAEPMPKEHGGPKGPEPTRYGDWERKGRCIDF